MTDHFDDFLDRTKWTDLLTHYKGVSNNIESNLKNTIVKERGNREKNRKFLETQRKIFHIDLSDIKEYKDQLLAGNVVGVDGTYITVDFTTGFQARIGVIATNYKNNKQPTLHIYVNLLSTIRKKEYSNS